MDAWRRTFDTVTVVVGNDLDAAEVVADALGIGAEPIEVSHLCPNCGGTDHGRPVVVAPARQRDVGVSIAHSHGIDAIAVNPQGSVGIDLESIAQVARRRVADVLVRPDEIAATPTDAARLWTTKEALLKLSGHGLRLDLRELRVSGGELVSWPSPLFADGVPNIRSFPITEDLIASVAW